MKNNLKNLLKEKGMTQSDLADELGISVRMVGHFIAGTRQLTDTWIVKIARVLDVNPGDLFINGASNAHPLQGVAQELLFKIIELTARFARRRPDVPIDVITSVVLAVYSSIASGKMPEAQESGKKLDQVLSREVGKLIDGMVN